MHKSPPYKLADKPSLAGELGAVGKMKKNNKKIKKLKIRGFFREILKMERLVIYKG